MHATTSTMTTIAEGKGLPEWLNKEYLTGVMNPHLKEKERILQFSITPGSEVGDNYMCQLIRIKITTLRGCLAKDYHVIAKYDSGESLMMQNMRKANVDLYGTESTFLLDLLPKLKQHTEKKIAPTCYHIDNDKEIIFMEDLTPLGFKIVPRENFLTFDECLKTVQTLAILHATSYLLIKKNPSIIENYSKSVMWNMPDFLKTFFNHSIDGIEEKIEQWNFSKKQKDIFQKFKEKFNKEGFSGQKLDLNNFNTLIHGDCWKNNIMYRYEKGSVQDAYLIDFQQVNYNCFALDLQFVLSSSAMQEVRYEKLDDILKVYYEEFARVAPNVTELNFTRIQNEFKATSFYGMVMAVSGRPFVVAQGGVDADGVIEGKKDLKMLDNVHICNEIKRALDYFEFAV